MRAASKAAGRSTQRKSQNVAEDDQREAQAVCAALHPAMLTRAPSMAAKTPRELTVHVLGPTLSQSMLMARMANAQGHDEHVSRLEMRFYISTCPRTRGLGIVCVCKSCSYSVCM